MNWLKYLDETYNELKKSNSTKDFHFYPKNNILLTTTDLNIVFLKQTTKTKILFEDCFGRRLYLTDIDIINIISKSPQQIFLLIIKYLTNYKEKFFQNELELNLNEKIFLIGLVIPAEEKDSFESLTLLRNNFFLSDADYNISYYDLLILISLIVDKEIVVYEENQDLRKQKQLNKYIILSSFYRDRSYKELLNTLDYNTEITIDKIYYNSNISKKIDLIFEDISY